VARQPAATVPAGLLVLWKDMSSVWNNSTLAKEDALPNLLERARFVLKHGTPRLTQKDILAFLFNWSLKVRGLCGICVECRTSHVSVWCPQLGAFESLMDLHERRAVLRTEGIVVLSSFVNEAGPSNQHPLVKHVSSDPRTPGEGFTSRKDSLPDWVPCP
jgi:hypothetical protein